MSLDLSHLTPDEVIQAVTDLASGGLTAFGQPELAALALALGTLGEAVSRAIQDRSAQATLTAEVDATDAAADAAEDAKFGPKP